MHWLCLFVARIIKPQAVSKTRLIFFAAYRLSTSKSALEWHVNLDNMSGLSQRVCL